MGQAGGPLKVCHVFAASQGGRWVCEQLDALRGHGCQGVAVLGGEGSTAELCRSTGIAVETFPMAVFGWKALAAFPFRVLSLAWWMRRQRVDVVQSHIMASTFYARPAAWLADVPVRLEMSASPWYMQAPSPRWIEKATAWMETGLIPSCEFTARLYREAGIAERLIQPVLYYGPHEDRFVPEATEAEGLRAEFGLAEDTPLIGSIAIFYSKCADNSFVPPETRGRYIKGHTDLIDAMSDVLREFPKARLVMIGCGWGDKAAEAEEDLRAHVAARGLEDVVLFAGWRPSTAAVYIDLDVSVQASLVENLGGTIESLLMARPTVATRVGGMPESVVDGETGVLVNPGDPADLARGIRELLRDPERAARLGRAGRELMLSRFTLTTTVPGLAAIYREQRAAARGAFRLHVSLWRLLLAVLIAPPIFARACWDVLTTQILPGRLARWRARREQARGRVSPPGALSARGR
ncbi:MAG TPA: glycosyltransferase family 4 protein [Allosphingosinicella sp.]|jgi:glycosyltransferase involved in cell wall biosynthesis